MAAKADELVEQLKSNGVRVISDTRDNYTPGWKYNHWELKVRLQSSSSLVALSTFWSRPSLPTIGTVGSALLLTVFRDSFWPCVVFFICSF